MTVKRSTTPLCLLAAGACCVAAAGACANTSNPGFEDAGGNGGGNSSSSSGGAGSSGTGSGAGSSGTGSGAGSNSSSSGSAGSSSSGGGSSSSGARSGSSSSGAGSGSSSSSGASSSSGGGGSCAVTATGGLTLQAGGYFPPNTFGMGGYTFPFSDAPTGMSTACISTTQFCGVVATGVMSAATWGGGIGVNLNQAMATSAAMTPINAYAATGTGIAYALNGISTGARLIIDNSPAYVQGVQGSVIDYCAPITAPSGTVPWAMFNTKCWDNSGMALAGPPTQAHHVQVQINATATAGSANYCVTSLKFM